MKIKISPLFVGGSGFSSVIRPCLRFHTVWNTVNRPKSAKVWEGDKCPPGSSAPVGQTGPSMRLSVLA